MNLYKTFAYGIFVVMLNLCSSSNAQDKRQVFVSHSNPSIQPWISNSMCLRPDQDNRQVCVEIVGESRSRDTGFTPVNLKEISVTYSGETIFHSLNIGSNITYPVLHMINLKPSWRHDEFKKSTDFLIVEIPHNFVENQKKCLEQNGVAPSIQEAVNWEAIAIKFDGTFDVNSFHADCMINEMK